MLSKFFILIRSSILARWLGNFINSLPPWCWFSWILHFIVEHRHKRRVKRHRLSDPIPDWPKQRSRRLSLPLPTYGCQASIQQPCPFFSRLPLEIRRRIYEFALGGSSLHLVVMRGKLRSQQCLETPGCWCKKRGYSSGQDPIHYGERSRLALLRSCRQFYSEAIEFLYSSNTFQIPHQKRDSAVPWALLFLPYFIPVAHLRQIRYLHICWRVDYPYPTSDKSLVLFQFPICGVTDGWTNCWRVLSAMRDLRELYIRFEVDEFGFDQSSWLAIEAKLLEGVKAVHVRNEFVVVLPFAESNANLDVGGSKCQLRLPKKCED